MTTLPACRAAARAADEQGADHGQADQDDMSAAAGKAGTQAELFFGLRDLRRVRLLTARWAELAGLSPDRLADFTIAVNEIATNAVVHGSSTAHLMLRAARKTAVEARIRDRGCWQRQNPVIPPLARPGRMGLLLVRLVCDDVDIRAGWDGTTVTLRMNLPPRLVRVSVARGR
jgi:serine/threonine-protein kinase RsbW